MGATDPSGHKCAGGPEECKDENGRTINGANAAKLRPKDMPGCGVAGKGTYGFHCTEQDLQGANLEQRLVWLNWLFGNMDQNIGPRSRDWFNNINTVVSGFVFAGEDDNQWLLNVDGTILVSLQDGYVNSIGFYSGDKIKTASGADKWTTFFRAVESGRYSPESLITLWGSAEDQGTQDGVYKFGQPPFVSPNNLFLFVGDIYRGTQKGSCARSSCASGFFGFFDPRTLVPPGISPVGYALFWTYEYDIIVKTFGGQ